MSGPYRTAADFRQALEARLEGAAAERGVGLNTLRQMVLMERLLARLFPPERGVERRASRLAAQGRLRHGTADETPGADDA